MIDWFTVGAQIVNFLILVVLLRVFLYGRIMAAMEKRQQEIADRWEEAQHQRDEAARELESSREKNRQLDETREQLLAEVRNEVEAQRQQLTAKVRAEVDEMQSRWSEAIREETESFLRDLRRRASEEVCAVARRALADLAGARLEQQMVEQFLDKLARLEEEERRAVIASMEERREVSVQTTHELPDDLREAITQTLRQRFLPNLDVEFEQSPDLLCGVALQTNAHKLAWNLRDYLTALEQELRHTLEEEAAAREPAREGSANVK